MTASQIRPIVAALVCIPCGVILLAQEKNPESGKRVSTNSSSEQVVPKVDEAGNRDPLASNEAPVKAKEADGQTSAAPDIDPTRPRKSNRKESEQVLLIEVPWGIAAFSKLLDKWGNLEIGVPTGAGSRLERSTVTPKIAWFSANDQLFVFSSEIGKWTKLEIPPEFHRNFSPVHIPEKEILWMALGGTISVFSAKTGEWTSFSAPPPEQPDAAKVSPSHQGLSWLVAKQANSRETAELNKKMALRSAQATELAELVRMYSSQGDKGITALSETRKELEKKLTEELDLKLKLEGLQIEELHARLSRLEQQHVRRQAQRGAIVERRARELIEGAELRWDGDKSVDDSYATGRRRGETASPATTSTQPSPRLSTQVQFLGPKGMKVVIWDPNVSLVLPARYNFVNGDVDGNISRVRLSFYSGEGNNVQSNSNEATPVLAGILEIHPVPPKSTQFLREHSVPLALTNEDYDQVTSGNFVTKVVFQPHGKLGKLALPEFATVVSTHLDPSFDPIQEAKRRGTVLLVLRLRPPNSTADHSGENAGGVPAALPSLPATGDGADGQALEKSYKELVTSLNNSQAEIDSAKGVLAQEELMQRKGYVTAEQVETTRRKLEIAKRNSQILQDQYAALMVDFELQIAGAEQELGSAAQNARRMQQAEKGTVPLNAIYQVERKQTQARLALERLKNRYELYKKIRDRLAHSPEQLAKIPAEEEAKNLLSPPTDLWEIEADAEWLWDGLGLKFGTPVKLEDPSALGGRFQAGLPIVEIKETGVAFQSGFRKGDVVVAMGKYTTASLKDLLWVLSHPTFEPNVDKLKIQVLRGKELFISTLKISDIRRN